jgi:hypothetical protein
MLIAAAGYFAAARQPGELRRAVTDATIRPEEKSLVAALMLASAAISEAYRDD